jgi:hypothetical protein
VAAPINDTSAWPLCRISMPRVAMTATEFEQHLQYIGNLFRRSEPFGLLIDARGGAPPSARERQAIGQRMREWFERSPRGMVGMAVVLSSAIERGVFTAITWAAGKTYPSRAFGTPEEAERWLRAALDQRSPPAPVPPR